MAPSPTSFHYIPTGAISIQREQANIDPELWSLPGFQDWTWFSRETREASGSLDSPSLAHLTFQKALSKSPALSSFTRLFREKWINLQFQVSNDSFGTVRVYLLPDDVARSVIDRSEGSLRKSRQSLLLSMDYSSCAWNGNPQDTPQGPLPFAKSDQLEDEQDMTLLQLFNRINSPNPDPSVVIDRYAQNAMYDLLGSKVFGLKATLYPYQRRSSALMLQKESQPGTVLDPRLQHVRDQNGKGWYLDVVSGTVLIGPRHYDGISGGILAEEMGSGKTLMCLALILATKDIPAEAPEIYFPSEPPRRPKLGSLADMAASCVNRHSVPWKLQYESYSQCEEVLKRNPGYYSIPAPESRRCVRLVRKASAAPVKPPMKIYTTSTTLIVVPNNLVSQWRQEIEKHTEGLKALILTKHDPVPEVEEIIKTDLVLFSQSRFEMLVKHPSGISASPLPSVHFKRCIVDEGHKLGNSRIAARSILHLGLDALQCSSRWIVTGTPSHGLYGVDDQRGGPASGEASPNTNGQDQTKMSSNQMEMRDLERIGAITALYLKARPWANTITEEGDSPADWVTYLMLPKHNSRARGRWDCLKTTLNDLIIRHQVSEIGELLPPVEEKMVVLEGSYQDRLSLNLFSMMIIFNSVQSQRTDQDYFFHAKQKRSLLQIVQNLKQASFFGGSFFAADEITKAVETAKKFLKEKKIPYSDEDGRLLRDAIDLGELACMNDLRNLSNQYHEMPVCVADFPAEAGQSWSLGGQSQSLTCTSTSLLLALQKLLHDTHGDTAKFNALLNGGLAREGILEKQKLLDAQNPEDEGTGTSRRGNQSQTLAGNTKMGVDSPRKSKTHGVNKPNPTGAADFSSFSHILEPTRITATVSAKMSYLLDSIVKYQEEEKIIIFYENDNIAWYLASMLDVIQVQHLIYAKSITTERRAQYVNTFHHNPTFRVLLMDLSQAAFGLDMREASRIYFISPVLNPQVEAQAIGRVRRISQKKPVSVETLVLKNSLDEVILERKEHMTQAEHRQTKSILDIPSIYNWIKNARIAPLPTISVNEAASAQMSHLGMPHPLFGRGFGRSSHPDDGLIPSSPSTPHKQGKQSSTTIMPPAIGLDAINGHKRSFDVGPGQVMHEADLISQHDKLDIVARPSRKVKFAAD